MVAVWFLIAAAAGSVASRLIVPMILIVVFSILALLLRALVAPAVLVITVLLSYARSLSR